jgi:5-methyltetrahydrofolate--homocysteine methyltransferase
VHHDDVEIYTDEKRKEISTTLHFLRQQREKPAGRPNQSLADFIAPKETGIKDHIGLFAVTAGIDIEKLVEEYEKANDTYNSIIVKAIADRLAEAFAEHMHERVRKEFWGYTVEEDFENIDLIKERYQGIRPAPGYPACPDHLEKAEIFKLLRATAATNIELTESMVMLPAASVCGYYFSHPEARYFGIARVYKDQVQDYSKRKQQSVEVTEKWLWSVLGYTSAPSELDD